MLYGCHTRGFRFFRCYMPMLILHAITPGHCCVAVCFAPFSMLCRHDDAAFQLAATLPRRLLLRCHAIMAAAIIDDTRTCHAA